MHPNLFCKGFTWGFFSREGDWRTDRAEWSMRRLASNGLNWICLTVNAWQETYHSLEIFSMYGRTQSDDDIRHAVKLAHSLGLKVCLKPMVNCMDRVWRSCIDFPTEEGCPLWDRWFQSYERFMLHYARLAQETGCEMLCTGCEMGGMDKQSTHCRQMIQSVRNSYKGIIMHNINHGDELAFDWLSAVDVIGISGYYPVTDQDHHDIETMRSKWKLVRNRLEACRDHYGRPVMMAEIGVRNERGCTRYPWDFHHRPDQPNDEEEQANFYQTAMEATWDMPDFCGYFWWDWKAILPPEEEMKTNMDFAVFGKQAEKVLRSWYTSRE